MTRFTEPNRHAGEALLNKTDTGFKVSGYQSYEWSNGVLMPKDAKTIAKDKIVTANLKPFGKTVLDLGSNCGYFMCYALNSGATEVVGVDIDEKYNKVAESALENMRGTDKWSVLNKNVEDVDYKADLVLCFAMVHWLYSCTALFGSLDKVIQHISSLTKKTAVIEFVHPNDPAMKFFNHNEYNPEVQEEEYNYVNFKAAMRKHFGAVQSINKINGSREAWVIHQK